MVGCSSDDFGLILKRILFICHHLINHEVFEVVPDPVASHHQIFSFFYLACLILVINAVLRVSPVRAHLHWKVKLILLIWRYAVAIVARVKYGVDTVSKIISSEYTRGGV